jgi:hypothetical protein
MDQERDQSSGLVQTPAPAAGRVRPLSTYDRVTLIKPLPLANDAHHFKWQELPAGSQGTVVEPTVDASLVMVRFDGERPTVATPVASLKLQRPAKFTALAGTCDWLFALDADGHVWRLDPTDGWSPMPDTRKVSE